MDNENRSQQNAHDDNQAREGGGSRSIEDVIREIENLIKNQPISERGEGRDNDREVPRAVPTVEIGSEQELTAEDPVLIIAEEENIPVQELLSMRRREINLADLEIGSVIFIVTPITRSTGDYGKCIVRNPIEGLVRYFYYHDQAHVGRYARCLDSAGHFSLTIEEGRYIYFFDLRHEITSWHEYIQQSTRCGALQIFVKPPLT